MCFQFGPENCNGVRNMYEKWKSVQKFEAKILNCLKTIKCSILKEIKKITSGCLRSSNLMES